MEERLFETSELGIIREVLKRYTNQNFRTLSNTETDALKIVWQKVKAQHQKQKREDEKFLEQW